MSNERYLRHLHAYTQNTIKNAAKSAIHPKAVYLDFEEVLSDGFQKIFPSATIRRDFFHLVQANVKKIGQLGLKSMASEVVADINTLWGKLLKESFDVYLETFLHKWDRIAPQYSKYFQNTWFQHHSLKDWAFYTWLSDARSGILLFYSMVIIVNFDVGSGVSEGYNRRLDSIMPRSTLALDVMVDFLAEEDKYWEHLVADSRLWQAKRKESNSAKEQHSTKRRQLGYYWITMKGLALFSTFWISIAKLMRKATPSQLMTTGLTWEQKACALDASNSNQSTKIAPSLFAKVAVHLQHSTVA